MKAYSDMNESERAVLKELYARIRKDMNASGGRYMFLLWGYVRGFPFRRLERTNHEHNTPKYLLHDWKKYLPDVTQEHIDIWLQNPEGAIPAPVRVKKPYEKPSDTWIDPNLRNQGFAK